MESIKSINLSVIEDYCKHYLKKYSYNNQFDTKFISLTDEDFENIKYLIKTLNKASIDNSLSNTKLSYNLLNKADKLSEAL